jgi:hypothetical protein
MARRITHKRLRHLIDYDQKTGLFTWKIARGPRKAGGRAGSVRTGPWGDYIQIHIDRQNYRGARVAWFWVHGRWPTKEIDHKNRRGTDNRLKNLRVASSSQNKMNRLTSGTNSTGLKGAFLDKRDGAWYSRIVKDRKLTQLGRFKTAKDAHNAYVKAGRKIYGEFWCQTH